eukprot:8701807-Prorocentrum_lima.AAC.1
MRLLYAPMFTHEPSLSVKTSGSVGDIVVFMPPWVRGRSCEVLQRIEQLTTFICSQRPPYRHYA